MKTQPAPGVIIVDDAQALRNALRWILIDEGFRILADLPNGGRLLELARQLKPEIICLDFDLPGADGLTLLAQVHAAYPEIAVVMITGTDSVSVERKAVDAGVAGFIRKPFSAAEIVAEMRQVAHAQTLLVKAQTGGTGEPLAGGRLVRAVIADDSATQRQLLTALLTQAGIVIIGEATNGEEAVRITLEQKPDFVFLDYAMPQMNGLEALQKIRALDPAARVMMITAHGDRELVTRCAQSGATGYILKPYRPERVLSAVTQLVAKL